MAFSIRTGTILRRLWWNEGPCGADPMAVGLANQTAIRTHTRARVVASWQARHRSPVIILTMVSSLWMHRLSRKRRDPVCCTSLAGPCVT
jgi:hypothetical protein